MKKKNRSERKEKNKFLRPWKGLTIWGIIFTLTFVSFIMSLVEQHKTASYGGEK